MAQAFSAFTEPNQAETGILDWLGPETRLRAANAAIWRLLGPLGTMPKFLKQIYVLGRFAYGLSQDPGER